MFEQAISQSPPDYHQQQMDFIIHLRKLLFLIDRSGVQEDGPIGKLNYGGLSFRLFRPVELLKWNGNRKQICRSPESFSSNLRRQLMVVFAFFFFYCYYYSWVRMAKGNEMVSAIDYLFSSCVDMYGMNFGGCKGGPQIFNPQRASAADAPSHLLALSPKQLFFL